MSNGTLLSFARGATIHWSVWHDSYKSHVWRTCGTHSYVCHKSLIWIICVTWRIHMCDMTHYMCDVTQSYVWHDAFICVTWLIHMCDMTRSYVWHDSFIYSTWLIHICDMLHSCVQLINPLGWIMLVRWIFFWRNILKIFLQPYLQSGVLDMISIVYFTR